jgi:hypothetical protein
MEKESYNSVPDDSKSSCDKEAVQRKASEPRSWGEMIGDFFSNLGNEEDKAEKNHESNIEKPVMNNVEKILYIWAYIILIGGTLFSLIDGIALLDEPIESLGVLLLVIGISGSITTWALLVVIVNISMTVREIKRDINKRAAQ